MHITHTFVFIFRVLAFLYGDQNNVYFSCYFCFNFWSRQINNVTTPNGSRTTPIQMTSHQDNTPPQRPSPRTTTNMTILRGTIPNDDFPLGQVPTGTIPDNDLTLGQLPTRTIPDDDFPLGQVPTRTIRNDDFPLGQLPIRTIFQQNNSPLGQLLMK